MVNNKHFVEKVTPRLEWGEGQLAHVNSLEDLDRLIDKLSQEAATGLPFSIELSMNSDTALSIVIGNKISHMNFFSMTSVPHVVGCRGLWNDDELFVFLYGNEYSEMPRKYCVPVEVALEALRQYFLTGVRPQNVVWNDAL